MGKLLNKILQTGGTIRKRERVEDKKILRATKSCGESGRPLP